MKPGSMPQTVREADKILFDAIDQLWQTPLSEPEVIRWLIEVTRIFVLGPPDDPYGGQGWWGNGFSYSYPESLPEHLEAAMNSAILRHIATGAQNGVELAKEAMKLAELHDVDSGSSRASREINELAKKAGSRLLEESEEELLIEVGLVTRPDINKLVGKIDVGPIKDCKVLVENEPPEAESPFVKTLHSGNPEMRLWKPTVDDKFEVSVVAPFKSDSGVFIWHFTQVDPTSTSCTIPLPYPLEEEGPIQLRFKRYN